ncbi:MAG: AAA family ATPase, partial [Clostridia bacterium]|nr:AAA family ATPase [Clostridia bacterium]
MLDTLNIQNVALIPNLKLDLGAGLNVLTGETGSGKSIIIGSLNFVLGDRADKTMIRNGANFAKVEAVFSTNHSVNVNQTLNELGIIPDEYTIISRLITIEGRSDCRVNGSLVTAQMLKLITSQLVDIHGQHEHQSLLKVKNHIDIIDNFAGAGLKTYKDNLIKAYDEHTFIIAQIDSLGGSDAERKSEADILQYQINEIEKLYLNEAEEEELINTISRLNNIERIANGINGAFVVLDGTDSMGVNSLLNSAITSLNSSVKYDNSLNLISERLNSVKIELGDITETLNEYASSLNYNQKEFDRLDSRLDSIKIGKKKYGGSIKEVFKFLESAKKRADLIEH